jgi:hypothetical protein
MPFRMVRLFVTNAKMSTCIGSAALVEQLIGLAREAVGKARRGGGSRRQHRPGEARRDGPLRGAKAMASFHHGRGCGAARAFYATRSRRPPLLEQCNVLVLSHLVPGREAVRVTISTGKPPDARRDAAKSMVAPNEGLAKFPITGGDQATIRSFSSVIRFAA